MLIWRSGLEGSRRSPQPPLLALGCLLIGWSLGFLRPWATGLPTVVRFALCLGLLLGAAGLGAWGLITFKRQGTTPAPNGTASALLTSGPFGHSRNPLYLALSSLLAGLGLMLDSVWVLLLVPGLVLLLDRLVIAREEVRLRAQFGDDYLAYQQRVRRWL